jgi:hypothetical protein
LNRHQRRTEMRSIRHSDLITHLIAADVPLDDHACCTTRFCIGTATSRCESRSASAASDRSSAMKRALEPSCCQRRSARHRRNERFLHAIHETLPLNAIDAASTRLLRQLAPGGKFLDPP